MAKKKARKQKKPKTSVTEAGVVVLAGFHNPSILNPDFLKSHDIVPRDWKVRESASMITFAQVGFQNGVTITLDPQRLRVTIKALSNFDEDFPIYRVAARYVEILPHVPYTALGINWKVAIPRARPENWITTRFLGTGEWRDEKPKIVDAQFIFRMRDGKIPTSFKIQGAKFTFPGQPPFMGVEVDTNAHHLGPFRDVDEITKLINNWPKRRQFIYGQTKRLIGRI